MLSSVFTSQDLDSLNISSETNTLYICFRTKDATKNIKSRLSWFYLDYKGSINDLKTDFLEMKNISNEMFEIIGVFKTEKEAEEYQEKDMLEFSKAFIPFAKEYIEQTNVSDKPFIVYINDPQVVKSGYYNMFSSDYKTLSAMMKMRLPTVEEIPNITEDSRVIFVHDLQPYINLELIGTILVKYDSNLLITDLKQASKLIYNRINAYRNIEGLCFKIAVKQCTKPDDDTINSHYKYLTDLCAASNLDIEYAEHLIELTKNKHAENPETFQFVKMHLPLVLMVDKKPVELDYLDTGHVLYDFRLRKL